MHSLIQHSNMFNVYCAPTIVPGTILGLGIHEGTEQAKIPDLMELISKKKIQKLNE